MLSKTSNVPEWTDGVIYWTFRDERIHGILKIYSCYIFHYVLSIILFLKFLIFLIR